ncbi:MAG TPA: hypothetical protein DCF95_00080 [Gammaproteobacteria bacterium]|nr:hypothetical protein [Gammaproteobacteria bacterium]|tara:strand:+ start:3374 stop:3559 length:186 start_codon:yes stop_codon:yes gene_type:complete
MVSGSVEETYTLYELFEHGAAKIFGCEEPSKLIQLLISGYPVSTAGEFLARKLIARFDKQG